MRGVFDVHNSKK